jgi:hypothetical protein
MRTIRYALAASLLGCFGLVAACLGEGVAPTSTASGERGERGGPCYPNGTCNGGLVCAAGVCAAGDAGSVVIQEPPKVAEPSKDAGTPVSVDSGGPCTVAIPALPVGPYCPGVGAGACAAGVPCCTRFGSNACEASCTPPDTLWACNARVHCGDTRCCLTTSTLDLSTCPATLSNVGKSECAATAGAVCSGRQLCATSGECAPGTCIPAEFNMGGTKVTLGVCQ